MDPVSGDFCRLSESVFELGEVMVPRAARRVRLLWNSTFVVGQDVWASALSQPPCGRPNGPDCAHGHSWRCPANSPGVRTIYDALCGRIQYLPRPQSSGGTTRAEHWIARLVNTVLGSRFKTIGTQRDSDNACAERCGESHQGRLRWRAVGVPRRPAAVGNRLPLVPQNNRMGARPARRCF